MNILFNLGEISRNSGGVYQYSMMLIKTLEKYSRDHNFYIYHHDLENPDIEIFIKKGGFKKFVVTKDFSYIIWAFFCRATNFFIKLFNLKAKPIIVDAFLYNIKNKNIEIIHSTFQSVIKVEKIKTITTMHDLQELHFPEYFSSAERAARATGYKIAIDSSDAVIVSFEHIKKDVVRFFDKPQDKVHVILLNMEDLWIDRFSKSDIQKIASVEHLQPFILYPAATWEHKNHIKLIEAIAYLRDQKKKQINLVCTGHLTHYYQERIQPTIEAYSLDQQVTFLGAVSDIELFSLYHLCKAVVIPTVYEAGSFPLIEAIMLNIPVVCSNVTSLPETIGNEIFTFKPTSIQDIANKVLQIVEDKDFIKKNIQNSKLQRKILKNTNSDIKMLNMYKDILS